MKKITICLLFLLPCWCTAQIGIKAGLNFANISKVSSLNNSSRSGFHAGILLTHSNKKIISSRTELLFSRQGYNYKTAANTGNVNLNYIILPQFLVINITKYFQIQLGAQIAYLLNAKVDSSNANGLGMSGSKMLDLYNRIDISYGGGIEIHPVKGLLLGARINISLGNLYKTTEDNQHASYAPAEAAKNNVFQVYSGWVFGKKSSKKKK